MIYAEELFYTDTYLSGRKPVIRTGFKYYAREASKVIDQYTFNRLSKIPESDIKEDVKMCCCELAEQCFRMEKQKKESVGKTSEKVGTHSVTYAAGSDISRNDAAEKRNIIMKWLGNTGLCYRGI